MLIAHVIGGVILIASLSLRMPQTSSKLSLFFTTFRSMAPVSLVQQIEDVFSLSSAFVDLSSSHSDIGFSPSLTVHDLVVYSPSFQPAGLGSAMRNTSEESVVREVDRDGRFLLLSEGEAKPASDPAARFDIFLLLALSCAIIVLYLTYVSRPRAYL